MEMTRLPNDVGGHRSPKTDSVSGIREYVGECPQGRFDQLAVCDTGLRELSAAGVIAGSDVTGQEKRDSLPTVDREHPLIQVGATADDPVVLLAIRHQGVECLSGPIERLGGNSNHLARVGHWNLLLGLKVQHRLSHDSSVIN